MKTRHAKPAKLLAILLTLAMCLSLLPATALAATSTCEYEKVEKDKLTNGAYIVVANSDKDGTVALGKTLSSNKLNGVGVTVTNNKITFNSEADANALVWNAEFSNNNGNVKLKTGSNYLGIKSSGSSRVLALQSSGDTTWTYNSKNQLTMNTYGLNYSSNSKSFSASSNGGDEPFAFYKKVTTSGNVVNVTPSTSNPTGTLALAVNEEGTIKITNGGSSEYTFTLSTGNSDVVSISQTSVKLAKGASGEVTVKGLKDGTATINIASNGQYSVRKATITVTVGTGGPIAESISLNDDTLTLIAKDPAKCTETLSATVKMEKGISTGVTWVSSDDKVATVNDNGEVTAVNVGTATITATTKDHPNKSASCTVTVQEKVTGDTVAITPTTQNPTYIATIAKDGTLTVNLTNGGSSKYTYTVSSEQTGIVSINPGSIDLAQKETGTITITGLAAGDATINIANTNSYSADYTRKATIHLTVTAIEPQETPVVAEATTQDLPKDVKITDGVQSLYKENGKADMRFFWTINTKPQTLGAYFFSFNPTDYATPIASYKSSVTTDATDFNKNDIFYATIENISDFTHRYYAIPFVNDIPHTGAMLDGTVEGTAINDYQPK